MKKTTCLMAVLLSAALAMPALAFAPPTEDQVAQVLADHSKLNPLVTGVAPQDAASVVATVINSVQGSTLPSASKAQTSALLYTRALLLSGANAPDMVASLAGQIDQKLIPAIAAATAIAVGGTEGPVIAALSQAAGAGGAGAVASAAADPASVLGADGVSLVQQLVIELRGVAAPVIPPPATSPMNLVPPIVPRNQQATTPPPPPVADTYLNQ